MAERRAKKAKIHHGKEEEEVRRDRLSDLPDAVLIHILSFLPGIKCAAQCTGLLSKRWNCLWLNLPNLVFHQYHCRDSSSFMDFVRHVLERRDGDLFVDQFSFYGSGVLGEDSPIREAIAYVVTRKVRHVSVNFPTYVKVLDPLFANASKFLITLKLEAFGRLHLLKDIDLPCLTTLSLFYGRFSYSPAVEPPSFEPFARMVRLKTLHLRNCRINDKNVTIKGTELDSFTFEGPYRCRFDIDTPNLRFFTFRNIISAEVFGHLHLPALKSMVVDPFLTREIREESLLDLINMFPAFDLAQSIMISSNVIEGLIKFLHLLQNQAFSLFSNLKTLTVRRGFNHTKRDDFA